MQELNRILFSALEHSLVDTSGSSLIHRLYHGTIVNNIVCSECGNVSQRQVCVDVCFNIIIVQMFLIQESSSTSSSKLSFRYISLRGRWCYLAQGCVQVACWHWGLDLVPFGWGSVTQTTRLSNPSYIFPNATYY